MKDYTTFLKQFLLLIFILSGLSLSAKKVVCIDDNGDPNDGFLNGHEAWERQEAGADDVIQKGGSLTDCMDQLEDGDTLVIVAHGTNEGEGFNWGGTNYTDFGSGAGEMPVPADFGDLDIHIKFCTCWSARDPDGPGEDNPDTPLTDKLKDKAGSGSTAEGFTDESEPRVCVFWTNGTAAQCRAVNDSLAKNTSWMDKPPHNRPGVGASNDKACILAIAQSFDADLDVNVVYYAPQNVTDNAVRPGSVSIGCDCSDGCGYYRAMFEDVPYPPDVETISNFPFPSGLWRTDDVLVIPTPGGGCTQVRNIRWLDPVIQMLPDGTTGPIPIDIEIVALAQTSVDGHVWFEELVPGFLSGFAYPLMTPPSEDQYWETEMVSMNLSGLGGPTVGANLTAIPGQPGTGITSLTDLGGGNFIVDSFFDIEYQVSLPDGTYGGPACGKLHFYLACDGETDGCTDPEAENFEGCALADDGSCHGDVEGCTYPGASNYNPNATVENGTCIFHGCTDPTANNYDPLANTDNGNCDHSIACQTDLDNNGQTDTADLLFFLTEYGTDCD